MKLETTCLHGGYTPKNGEPRVVPICQSTTFAYDSAEHIGKLFDLEVPGFFYSRLGNPTVGAVEDKINLLEGGVGALCTTSGQAANMIAILNICQSGDHFVSGASIYGGTFNLFGVTLKKMGIDCTFVGPEATDEEIEGAFRPNTKAVFGETLANPGLTVLDIERYAKIAHGHGVPLIVDNTFATPVLCRPFTFGADIVTHSTTKYMDGHALQVGGVIVDSGNFPWDDKYPCLTQPDESYHGLVYTKNFGRAAYITKARTQMTRDMGTYPSAHAAFLLNLGLETLPLRMERYCTNAQAVAEFLAKNSKVESVNYPGLQNNPYYQLGQRYLPKGCSGVISFQVKGGKKDAIRFMDSLKLASIVVHVADIRTCVLHPASSTHRQLSQKQLADAGINESMIRLSVGLEHIDDILEDLQAALAQI